MQVCGGVDAWDVDIESDLVLPERVALKKGKKGPVRSEGDGFLPFGRARAGWLGLGLGWFNFSMSFVFLLRKRVHPYVIVVSFPSNAVYIKVLRRSGSIPFPLVKWRKKKSILAKKAVVSSPLTPVTKDQWHPSTPFSDSPTAPSRTPPSSPSTPPPSSNTSQTPR